MHFSKMSSSLEIDNRFFPSTDDSLAVYYRTLELREKMIGDILRRLKVGDTLFSVKQLLGSGIVPCNGCALRSIPLTEGFYNALEDQKLSYMVGYNASGTCFLTFLFKDNKITGIAHNIAI